ncbi:alpha-(1,6)-fucosyltransferase-like isoform X2 [Tachypleus tridentatus]
MSFVKRNKFAIFVVLCVLGFIVALEYHWHNHIWSFEHMKYQLTTDHRKSDQIINFISNSEDTRRYIEFVVEDMWYFILSKLKPFGLYLDSENSSTFKQLLDQVGDYKRVALIELKKLGEVNNQESWRQYEHQRLSDIVQSRIYNLQFPNVCQTKRILVCDLKNSAGLASRVHDIMWCLINSYNLNQTMVLVTKHWEKSFGKWEKVFKPLSSCDVPQLEKPSPWPGINNAVNRVLLRSLPADLLPSLKLISESPLAWWYGQFVKFILRPQEELFSYAKTIKGSDFIHPIVGLHVRRTDKIGKEASSWNVEEYMVHVEDFYRQLELEQSVSVKRVFVATDDHKVLRSLQESYKNYTFLTNLKGIKTAEVVKNRFSMKSLFGAVTDVFLLAHTDFLVCTFSSGFCRLSYELMQTLYADISRKAHSLDVEYHYAGSLPPSRQAMYPHSPLFNYEMALQVRDVLTKTNEYDIVNEAKEGRSWDGYNKAYNLRTNLTSLYPTYKTKPLTIVGNFPKYANVKTISPSLNTNFENL